MPEGMVLYTRFKTRRDCYIYDTYSNAILRTTRPIWDHFDHVMSGGSDSHPEDAVACAEAHAAVDDARRAGLFQPCNVTRMAFYPSDDTLRTRVTQAIPHLTLEVTEQCNLRCHYCAHTYDARRTSTPAQMSPDTAKQAVSVFLAHSTMAERRSVSFWGGEPLLAFPLIRDVVRHVRERTQRERTTFSFTTNATLVTDEIATFVAEAGLQLLVSLDGPRHIHNKHRRTAAGRGSFDATLAGLRRLRAADAEYYRKNVRFNCVLARDTALNDVEEFFAEHELLSGHAVTITPANRLGVPSTPETDQFGGIGDEQHEYARVMLLAPPADGTPLQPSARFYAKRLEKIALRPRAPLGDTVQPNACCVPLLRRLLIRHNGGVYMCEQAPYMNCLGRVEGNACFDRAVEVVREYASRSLPDCRRCWAMRLCGACYRDTMVDGEWAPAERAAQCRGRRGYVQEALAEYVSVCEENPAAFEYLKEFTFSFPV